MSPENGEGLWRKVDYNLVVPQVTPAQTPRTEDERSGQSGRVGRLILDALGTLLWLDLIIQTFVTDIDRAIFGDLAKYRLLFFLAVAAALALVIRKKWVVLAASAYIIGFPLVVLFLEDPEMAVRAGKHDPTARRCERPHLRFR